MKTTLEIPDAIFRRAKSRAAEQGVPLRQFVSDAVANRLRTESSSPETARKRLAGKLRHLRSETARIDARIEREFEGADIEHEM
jgi:hypothetical protein